MTPSLEPINLAGPTITSHLVEHPNISPARAAKQLFPKPFFLKRLWLRFKIKDDLYHRSEPTPEELERARKAGRWHVGGGSEGAGPSQLFLKIYADVLLCLERDPLCGVVSPPLLGSCGTMPLTILSVIPDIMKHYYDCIVLAEQEVLLATNYLQPSDSQRTICDALIELSRRVGKRGQKEKVVVKLIYDRGNWRQLFKNHQAVKPNTSAWNSVKLPNLDDIPNLHLEVINFHRVLLGTFHAKYLVVDRKVALLNSNNIQDRPNIEMMIHLEGPIVDSFYDMFLISWSNALRPTLPYLTAPKVVHGEFKFLIENPFLASIDVIRAAREARAILHREAEADLAHPAKEPRLATVVHQMMEERWNKLASPADGHHGSGHYQGPAAKWAATVQSMIEERRQEQRERKAHKSLEVSSSDGAGAGRIAAAAGCSSLQEAIVVHHQHERASSPTTTAVASETEGSDMVSSQNTLAVPSSPVAAKADVTGVRESEDVQSADTVAEGERLTETASPEPMIKVQEPEEIEAEPKPQRATLKSSEVQKRMRALSNALNAGTLRRAHANVSEDHIIDDFRPHTLHVPHAPFPIAMVNRRPHGMPGHHDIRVPQNAAWMAGFRYAKRKVFIQTPTLNAKPVVRLCVDTAKRGVEVILYLDLGFNDKGESIPFQGGTNQEVVIRMYKVLRAVRKEKYLLVYWYTGKDQIRPINAVLKSRNCHVKFMAVDDEVGIQGNGNMDTQSWFHSQEINILIDSRPLVRDWMQSLIANQNTQMFGKVGTDGIWRDAEGRTVDDYDRVKMAKPKPEPKKKWATSEFVDSSKEK